MKKTIFLILIIIFFYPSFSRNPGFKMNHKVKSDSVELKIVELLLKGCQTKSGIHVIENENDYFKLTQIDPKDLLVRPYLKSDCPKINFNKYVLMGIDVTCGGCKSPTMKSNLYYLKSEKRIVLNIELNQFGGCALALGKRYFFLVKRPKLKNIEYKVNYKVNYIEHY